MAESGTVISEEYRRLQQELHQNPRYGEASIAFAPTVKKLLEEIKATSLSDYGAGKQNLHKELQRLGFEIEYRPYDPAFPEYGAPQPADMVCCIDVLEHIEPDFLGNVLDDLKSIIVRFGFLSIHTGPAKKHLADGRNAHLIQKPSSWWLPKICERFEVDLLRKTKEGFYLVVSPRKAH